MEATPTLSSVARHGDRGAQEKGLEKPEAVGRWPGCRVVLPTRKQHPQTRAGGSAECPHLQGRRTGARRGLGQRRRAGEQAAWTVRGGRPGGLPGSASLTHRPLSTGKGTVRLLLPRGFRNVQFILGPVKGTENDPFLCKKCKETSHR